MKRTQTVKRFLPRLNRTVYLVTLLVIPGLSPVVAEPAPPYLCTGYIPETKSWNRVGVTMGVVYEENCPAGYAYLNQDYAVGLARRGRYVGVRGTCCRLPDGVLRDVHTWELESCPEDSVGTGARAAKRLTPGKEFPQSKIEWETTDQFIRCTKIDTARYRLGPPAETLIMGFHFGFNINTLNGAYTTRNQIPLGFRYGSDRDGRLTLETGGCLGYPWGSLFTAKRPKQSLRLCNFEFRPLEYLGAPGDPPPGTPVKIFPDCAFVTNLFNDDHQPSECIKIDTPQPPS